MNETPSSNRLHIGIFGKTNSGKSSLVNQMTGQSMSIVANVPGTTTDVVQKAIELHPLGPCVLLDTAGFDDSTELGALRIEKTRLAASKVELAIIVFQEEDNLNEQSVEYSWFKLFQEMNTPVLWVCNVKGDTGEHESRRVAMQVALNETLKDKFLENLCIVNCKTGDGIGQILPALVRLMPENYGNQSITGTLVSEDDMVLLVMPQDIQAPKGRLILPQVQTIRELLDKKCMVISVTTDKLVITLEKLKQAPKLIITDSQVFDYVYQNKPAESMLTSFSVLFAAYKGDIQYYVEGAKAIDTLRANSKVLIAECCTHAPLSEDIGRVKIPRLLKKRIGETLQIEWVRGTDFPKNLDSYDLIIQCGACMFNRKYVLSRIACAKEQSVPMTNYGVTIAHLTGILDKIVTP